MAKREVPEINSSSMADIAFMLLIFFLVATTMDVDSGLARMLPPPVPEQNEDEKPPEIKERNVFVVLLNKNNQLLVENRPMTVGQLKDATKEFIQNPLRDENLPEVNEADIPLIGKFDVSKGVVSLQNDRGTAYKLYIEVQNELVAAYSEAREELSRQKFGKKFDDLNEDQSKAIKKAIPQRISEAEPKNVGGK